MSAWRACSSRGVSGRVCSGVVMAGRIDLGSLSFLGLLGLIILRLDRLGRSVSVEERLVILLGFDKGILKGVGVWEVSAAGFQHKFGKENVLSELAKRIARVTASASPSLTSAAAFHTQLRSDPTLGDSFISGTTEKRVSLRRHIFQGHRILFGKRYTHCSGWRRP